jgi:hypothetical protein
VEFELWEAADGVGQRVAVGAGAYTEQLVAGFEGEEYCDGFLAGQSGSVGEEFGVAIVVNYDGQLPEATIEFCESRTVIGAGWGCQENDCIGGVLNFKCRNILYEWR